MQFTLTLIKKLPNRTTFIHKYSNYHNMIQKDTTNSVRIDKDILDKIRVVAKSKGQTILGYININLSKQVNKDWLKFENKLHEKKNNI